MTSRRRAGGAISLAPGFSPSVDRREGGPRQVAILTPNPTLDTIYAGARYELYGKSFYGAAESWAGGSGINVSRGLRALGVGARVFTILGGGTGELARRALAGEGLDLHAVSASYPTRTTAVEYRPEGKRMAVSPSLGFTAESIAELAEVCGPALEQADWIFFGGSFPAPADLQERLLDLLSPYRQKLVTDTRGTMLHRLLDLSPYCVKLDSTDFLDAGGAEMSLDLVLENARRAHAAGVALVCVEAAGRLLAVHAGSAHPYPQFGRPAERAYGRGDAFMAGLLFGLCHGRDADLCVRLGIVAGTAEPPSGGLGGIDARKFRDGMAALGLASGEQG